MLFSKYLLPPGAGPFERAYRLTRDAALIDPATVVRPYRARSRSEYLSPLEAAELVERYGNISAAAKEIGMPRSTFRDLLKDAEAAGIEVKRAEPLGAGGTKNGAAA